MHSAVPATAYIATLPATFIIWWFTDNVKLTFKILSFFFLTAVHVLGYKSLFTTFFKPWKNEYREGLVVFSRIVGVSIKSLLIFTETFIVLFLLATEITIFIFWVFLPFIVLWGIYASLFA